ncbi:MAG TPA: FAD-dependent oxidoreductase, partial [Gaiellales bacterium]|nr:FAD-dependent oxidoreductase [Gaiellales bacterium]
HGVQVLNGRTTLPEELDHYDMVVAGIGVTPNLGLARDAGLATASGVLVDDHLSAGEGIWAVGDIAEFPSAAHGGPIRVEHWDVALKQGGYVGRLWAGTQDGPYDVVPYFFSDIGDWTWFEYVGPGSGDVELRGSMDDDDFVAYWTRPDGAVTACLGVNRSDDVEAARQLISEHRPPPPA